MHSLGHEADAEPQPEHGRGVGQRSGRLVRCQQACRAQLRLDEVRDVVDAEIPTGQLAGPIGDLLEILRAVEAGGHGVQERG